MSEYNPIMELIRLEMNYIYGTFGIIKINKRVFSVCLEPPDMLNKSNISSIPVGQYICKRYSSDRYSDTFQVMNVPNRYKILFHAGTFVENTEGCILLARKFGVLKGARVVLNSGNTFKQFMNIMLGIDEFQLTITEQY